jgi:hypothetical protein
MSINKNKRFFGASLQAHAPVLKFYSPPKWALFRGDDANKVITACYCVFADDILIIGLFASI